ncbi:outer membrane receptor for ferrienterochelin and colicins [Segatella bryantii]|uniref:TonB-dependent receptor plug domain-containing protein n=1 Tax=Segatella bryantii TaxID=77095 RepID=UPI000897D456|nr:TonB-dependent receptor [Segatella bryantii]SEA63511.1 outer membrane receptor for ferrienterochelin and colicins [Segatella bryantii]
MDNTSHEQNNIDAYAQFDFNPSKRFNLVGSLRYDYFSASGADALTARLAAVCKLNRVMLRANYASGFRAPSLKEMYMHFDMGNMGYIIMGNPDLKPEKSNNFNVAAELSGMVRWNWLF